MAGRRSSSPPRAAAKREPTKKTAARKTSRPKAPPRKPDYFEGISGVSNPATELETSVVPSPVAGTLETAVLDAVSINDTIHKGMLSTEDALFAHMIRERSRIAKLSMARDFIEDKYFTPDFLNSLPPAMALQLREVIDRSIQDARGFAMDMHTILADGATMDRLLRIVEKGGLGRSDISSTKNGEVPKLEMANKETELAMMRAIVTEINKRKERGTNEG